MTDRLHSCKESPDGRHRWQVVEGLETVFRCAHCDRARVGSTVLSDAGAREEFWRDIGRPVDAHLGAVEP